MDNSRIELTLELERIVLHRRHALEYARQLEERAELLRRHLKGLDRTRANAVSIKGHHASSDDVMPPTANATEGRRVLRLQALQAATGLSASSIYRLIRQGDFPKPIHLGVRAVGWLRTDIENWLTQRHRR